MTKSILCKFVKTLRHFRSASGGNISVMFALSLVPITGAVGAAVDYSQSSSIKAAMQAAADSAALGGIKAAATLAPAVVTSTAIGMFNASFNRTSVRPSPGATYDPTSGTLTVTATASYTPQFMKIAGVSTMHISVTSKAKLGGTTTWPVCVLVTNPTSNHTLKVQSGATIDFTNCMVQVNTANWDAVEARDTSYIHSTNGVNCFTGDIHYGDVTPPKQATCTMLPDPYASYVVPSNNPCTYTNKQVNNASTTLTPGTYCGGLKITNSANVTLSPGVYYIQNGDFTIAKSANVDRQRGDVSDQRAEQQSEFYHERHDHDVAVHRLECRPVGRNVVLLGSAVDQQRFDRDVLQWNDELFGHHVFRGPDARHYEQRNGHGQPPARSSPT